MNKVECKDKSFSANLVLVCLLLQCCQIPLEQPPESHHQVWCDALCQAPLHSETLFQFYRQLFQLQSTISVKQQVVLLKCDSTDQNESDAGILHCLGNSELWLTEINAPFQILMKMDTEIYVTHHGKSRFLSPKIIICIILSWDSTL